ncbi:MAG: 3-methyl-2-oxobutanoate hydroxymethyltransferase [Verrucomicrobiales bacterium]|jgi:3-methyl-2-oxobutanoate hydroxymethyltransferase|nr:3-methyl-2-oxobutanoate hydroxymethyltransferase [Verrucomicrobiales bacterium]
MSENRVTWEQIRQWRGAEPILALTAYDYPLARHLDEAGVDILHVGDSLGMVVLGYQDTTAVTLDDMIHHTRAVARARRRALLTADLPYRTYTTPAAAVASAGRLIDAGADAVKLEGGEEILPQLRAVLAAGIPVLGHLGLLPQQVREAGGVYRKKGKTGGEIQRLKKDALLLQEAGVFAVVLEAVVSEVAATVTAALTIPTIGIASGRGMTGQIRVAHDVLGLTPWFAFPHIKPLANLSAEIRAAVERLRQELRR